MCQLDEIELEVLLAWLWRCSYAQPANTMNSLKFIDLDDRLLGLDSNEMK